MEFYYNSSQTPVKKVLSAKIVTDVARHISEATKGRNVDDMTYGEIMDIFLAYRRPNGNRLLINQLEPLYTHFCLYREIPVVGTES